MNIEKLKGEHPDWEWSFTQPPAGEMTYGYVGTRKEANGTVERAKIFMFHGKWMVDYESEYASITILGRPEEYEEWSEYIKSKCPTAYDTPFDAMNDPCRGIKRGVEARKCEKCGDWHVYKTDETLEQIPNG